jgi:hypothetical protein
MSTSACLQADIFNSNEGVQEAPNLIATEKPTHVHGRISCHGIRSEPCQPHVAVGEADHEIDMLPRHGRMPAPHDLCGELRAEWLHAPLWNPVRVGCGAVSDGDQANAAVAPTHRVTQGRKLRGLYFVGHDDQANVRFDRGAIDQLVHPPVGSLLQVDDFARPRCMSDPNELSHRCPMGRSR